MRFIASSASDASAALVITRYLFVSLHVYVGCSRLLTFVADWCPLSPVTLSIRHLTISTCHRVVSFPSVPSIANAPCTCPLPHCLHSLATHCNARLALPPLALPRVRLLCTPPPDVDSSLARALSVSSCFLVHKAPVLRMAWSPYTLAHVSLLSSFLHR